MIKLPAKQVFRVDEVANLLNISISTVYYMLRNGDLKAINPTGKKCTRITYKSLECLIRRRHKN